MLSPCKIPRNSSIRKQKYSKDEPQLESPSLTLFDLKTTPTTTKESSPEVKLIETKNKLKGGDNIEINGKYLHEILHNSNS